MKKLLLVVLLVLLVCVNPIATHAQTTNADAARRALPWLRPQQGDDGGYGDMPRTVAILHALGDAGADPAQWRNRLGISILDYITPRADEFARSSPANAARLITALVAAGQDPRALGHLNLVARLQDQYDPARGTYGGRTATTVDQAWALLALAALREPAPEPVLNALIAAESTQAGWGGPTSAPDVETTAVAIAALIGAGIPPTDALIGRGISFIALAQTSTGGFSRAPGCACAADTLSTARAVQAILMAGQDPLATGWRRPGGLPTDWLRQRQDQDGGFGRATATASDWTSTAYAVSALLGRRLAPHGLAPATRSALTWLRGRQTAEGGFAPVGSAADVDFTLDAIFALTASRQSLDNWSHGGRTTLLDYVATHAPRSTPTAVGRLILAVVALGGDPRGVNGVDLVRRLDAFYIPGSGAYGTTAPDQAWAILALAAVHRPPFNLAYQYLSLLRAPDGGWRPDADQPTDTLTTALVIQALATTPGHAEARQLGRTYLLARRQPDGGLSPTATISASATRATAWGMLALASLSESPDSVAWTRHATRIDASALPANTPFRYLLAMQNPDGGFRPQPDFPETDPLATIYSLTALAGRPQPIVYETVRLFLPLLKYAAPKQ